MPAAVAIIAEVGRASGAGVRGLMGRSRRRALVRARWWAAWRLRNELGLSLPHIGRLLGGRHHTTIMYGLRAVAADPTMRE